MSVIEGDDVNGEQRKRQYRELNAEDRKLILRSLVRFIVNEQRIFRPVDRFVLLLDEVFNNKIVIVIQRFYYVVVFDRLEGPTRRNLERIFTTSFVKHYWTNRAWHMMINES